MSYLLKFSPSHSYPGYYDKYHGMVVSGKPHCSESSEEMLV